jgi:8-oxo-dGTP pyrophosphatase MutT (NUDIX family)
MDSDPQWLKWSRELQALSQIGLTFSTNEHEIKNFQRLGEIAAEMVQMHTRLDTSEVLEAFSVQPGYATAKIDVRGAVIRRGQILLVQERSDQRWCMPGGWADVGEIPSAMVAREVFEESGFTVQPTKVIGVYDANRGGSPLEFFHAFKIVFLCQILSGEPQTSIETQDVQFFDFDDLPELSPNRTNDRHLKEVQAHLADPARATVFD